MTNPTTAPTPKPDSGRPVDRKTLAVQKKAFVKAKKAQNTLSRLSGTVPVAHPHPAAVAAADGGDNPAAPSSAVIKPT